MENPRSGLVCSVTYQYSVLSYYTAIIIINDRALDNYVVRITCPL